jgi:3-oxoacyl-[acyl-carrier protein] reductase
MSNNFVNRTAFVTGASRGIGAAVGIEFLKKGVDTLILTARDTPRFDDTLKLMQDMAAPNQTIVPLRADLFRHEAVMELIDEVKGLGRNIDFLVNNAGFTAPKTIFEATFEELQKTIQVNLFAPFLTVQSLLQSGNKFKHIVNIASTAGIKGRAGWSTYSSSKAALIAMSEAMREELLPLGTRVSCISPGRCATDLRKTLAPDEAPTTIMQPEDVAEVISFLLSDLAHFVDSENIIVRL